MRGFPLQDTGPGMRELFHDLQVEQEERRAASQRPIDWDKVTCEEWFERLPDGSIGLIEITQRLGFDFTMIDDHEADR